MKKFFSILTAAVFAVAVAVPSASALSLADVELLITLGIIPADKAADARAALGGGTTPAPAASNSAFCGPFTRDLTMGSTGVDVTTLQTALESTGDLVIPVGVSKGYFGGLTKSALASFQAKKAISPAIGYFGPISKAAFASMCSAAPVTPGTTPGTGTETETNTGSEEITGEGSVDSWSSGSADETEALEGEEDVEIFVVEAELDDEGNLLLERADVWFSNDDAGSSDDDPWEYFESIALTVNGEVVAEEDADSSSDWSDDENGNLTGTNTTKEYRLRFSGIDAVLMEDETNDIGVEVTMAGTIDSADQSAEWNVGVTTNGFKLLDGTDFSFTDGAAVQEEFTVGSEDVADIDVSSSSDDPDATVIEVSDSSDTNGVAVGIFEIEESEGIDVTHEEITVGLQISTVATGTIGDVIKKAYLLADGDVIGTENVSGSGTTTSVVFDGLGFDQDGDSTVEFSVELDLEDTNDEARYSSGVTVQVASVSVTEAEDGNGNDEGDITMSGSFASETHELRSQGIIVDIDEGSVSVTSVDSEPDTVQFSWSATIKAIDDDVFITDEDDHVTATSSASDVNVYFMDDSSTAITISATGGEIDDDGSPQSETGSGAHAGQTFYRIDSNGDTFDFVVIATNAGTPGSEGNTNSVKAFISNIEWITDFTAAAASINSYTFELEDDSKTDSEPAR